MKTYKSFVAIFFFSFFLGAAFSQNQDSLKVEDKKEFVPLKNVIRFNPTPNLLGFKSIIFGYERVVTPSQSFSINAGFLAFQPSDKKQARRDSIDAALGLDETRNNKGFSIAADYRFYLKKENKYPAQRGVYLGPYVSSYYFDSENTIKNANPSAVNGTVNIGTEVLVFNIGAELGYQFVIKNRFTIDLILAGPSISRYYLKLQAKGDLDVNDPEIEEALEKLKDILVNQFEWLKPFLNGEEISAKGSISIWNAGMRYGIQVGYRF